MGAWLAGLARGVRGQSFVAPALFLGFRVLWGSWLVRKCSGYSLPGDVFRYHTLGVGCGGIFRSSECSPCKAMSITVQVCLVSGRTVDLDVDLDSTIDQLSQRASRQLGTGRGRLSKNCGVIDGHATVEQCGLQDGDVLSLIEIPVQVAAASFAFAALLRDGSVVTWGHEGYGGNSWAVKDHLKDVQAIHGNRVAFAAIGGHGAAWGLQATQVLLPASVRSVTSTEQPSSRVGNLLPFWGNAIPL